MKRTTKLMFAIAPALFAAMLWTLPASADPDMAKKEKKECVVCHTEDGSPELNKAGEYYKKNKKLPPAQKK